MSGATPEPCTSVPFILRSFKAFVPILKSAHPMGWTTGFEFKRWMVDSNHLCRSIILKGASFKITSSVTSAFLLILEPVMHNKIRSVADTHHIVFVTAFCITTGKLPTSVTYEHTTKELPDHAKSGELGCRESDQNCENKISFATITTQPIVLCPMFSYMTNCTMS